MVLDKPNWEAKYWFSFKDSCVSVLKRGLKSERSRFCLFFLHGRFGDAAMWHSTIQGLEKFGDQFQSFSVDLPGFGRSFCIRERGFSLLEHVSLVQKLIEHLTEPDEKVVLIGHDVGGGIAQLCSIQIPQKIEALILINSACVANPLRSVSIGNNSFLCRRKLGKLLQKSKKIGEIEKKAMENPWRLRNTRMALIRAFRAIDESWPWHYERRVRKEELKQLKHPVLLLWGNQDLMNPLEIAKELEQKLSQADLFIHQEAGYLLILEQTHWVCSKISGFMKKIKLKSQLIPDQKFLLK